VGPHFTRQHKDAASQDGRVMLKMTDLQAAMRYGANGTVMAGVARLDRMIVDNLRDGSEQDEQEAHHAPDLRTSRS